MPEFSQNAQVLRDLDPDFIESFAVDLAWQYDGLYERLSADATFPDWMKAEEFRRERSNCAVRAGIAAANAHGVPFEVHRLRCNGQRKLIIKSGRVIIIQEPIDAIDHRPAAADYKVELADAHGFVRQLELDLGDQPHRIQDWSGCTLSVLLHGSVGLGFDPEQCQLGATMLAIPDASYGQWIARYDLQTIAMFGRQPAVDDVDSPALEQEDRVIITSKKRNTISDVG